jgi:hypothetical protein
MIGLYGPEVITWLTGGIGRNVLCTVYLRGTTTKALLYADPNGFSGITNPLFSDQYGRITFYAELGEYDLMIEGTTTPVEITVPSGGVVDRLDELQDVSVAGATPLQVLAFDGVNWTAMDQSGGEGGSTPDATALIKGKLRLTGDFGGTADSPTVPGLADKATTAALASGLASKQDAGDYATNAALTSGLAGKQAVGDYATNTALSSGLAGKQNAGDYVTGASLATTLAGYATDTELTDGLATKQNAGSYATTTQLTDGLATKQPTGDYATNTAMAAKYTKPGTGIPEADLTAAINASLDLADSSVQPADLALVATSGVYADLTGKPSLFSGAYSDLTGKPVLFDGTYAALTGKPDLTVYATKAFVDGVATLTDAATIATNAALAPVFTVTLAGNRTLGVPTNPSDGMRRTWRFRQDATGTRTITLATGTGGFVLGSQIANTTLTGTANKVGYMTAMYDLNYPGGARWCVLAFEPGV